MAGTNRRSTPAKASRAAASTPKGRRRLIDYPRRGYTGVRRWLPSWRFLVGGVLSFLFLGLGLAVAAYVLIDIPEPDDFVHEQTSTAYFSDGTTPIGTFPGAKRTIVDYGTLPEYVGQAVVSAEDRTFFENQGISIPGMARALINNLRGGETQGGSTLTQQYVERYYVGETTTSYVGKAKEALLAIKIAQKETKEEILGRYLNTIYFGRDAYGIEAASQAYFGHPAAQLTLAESAMLAGIIPSPNNWDPATNPEKAQERWDYVLDGMVKGDFITQADRDAAQFPAVVTYTRSDTYGGTNGYLLQYIENELTATGSITSDDIRTGGMTIVTSIEADVQAQAVEAVRKLRDGELSGGEKPADTLKIGVVSIDPTNGGIVAMYGGPDFLSDQYNRALYGIQAGSTFKPFTLLTALQEGIPLTARYDGNSPRKFAEWGDKPVNNFGNEDFGTIDLVKATANSVNTVYAELNIEVDPAKTAETATKAGITTPVTPVPSNVLGVDDVKPLDMASAYATIAAQGAYHKPFMVAQATYPDGKVAYTGASQPSQVLDPDVTADATYAMTQVVEQGSGKKWIKPIGRDIAGKTGTSNENRSAWFMGFTPQIVTAVAFSQVGDNGSDLVTITPWGRGVKEITGATWPAAMWAAYMEPVLELPKYATPTPFPKRANVGATAAPTPTSTPTTPPTEEPEPEQPATVTVPSVPANATAGDAQAAITNAGLVPAVRQQSSSSVASGVVITLEPGPGAQVPPGSTVTVVVSTGPEVVQTPPPAENPGGTTQNNGQANGQGAVQNGQAAGKPNGQGGGATG